MTQTPQWKIFELDGNVGMFLVDGALVGAIIGVGKARLPLAISAVLGFFMWLPLGVL